MPMPATLAHETGANGQSFSLHPSNTHEGGGVRNGHMVFEVDTLRGWDQIGHVLNFLLINEVVQGHLTPKRAS